MSIHKVFNNEKGAVLVTGLMFLAILTLIGSTAYLTTSNELKTSRNYKISKKALYDAEAGIEFALGKVEGYLVAGTSAAWILPASGSTNLPDSTPTGFNFTLSSIASAGTNTWSLISTGNTLGATASIEVYFQRVVSDAFTYAAFGDDLIDAKAWSGTCSYDSTDTNACTNDPSCAVDCYADPDDDCFVSTGKGDVGSNGTVDLKNHVDIDGTVVIGEGGTIIDHEGDEPTETIPPIDPDPLDINGGGVYDPTTYAVINDNDDYIIDANGDPVGAMDGTHLDTKNESAVTLCGKPGGANIYLTEVDIQGNDLTIITDGSGDCAAVDASGGPVNIFLDSGSTNKPWVQFHGDDIVFVPSTPDATSFAVYANACCDNIIEFKTTADFMGVVYAPNAKIQLKHDGTFYGMAWGNEVELKSSAEICFDEALADWGPTTTTGDASYFSWRNIRN